MRIAPLDRSQLAAAAAVLEAACRYERAGVVAEEKLFGNAPKVPTVLALGAWEGDALVGVAAVAGNRVRLVAVMPAV